MSRKRRKEGREKEEEKKKRRNLGEGWRESEGKVVKKRKDRGRGKRGK